MILVASFPRSGTHLLIDALINNFPAYKTRPLYVAWEHMSPDTRERFAEETPGGVIVKTHWPHHFPNDEPISDRCFRQLARLADRSVVIQPVRQFPAVYKSYVSIFKDLLGTEECSEKAVGARFALFNEYWSEREVTRVWFEELVSEPNFPNLIAKLAKVVGSQPREHLIAPEQTRWRNYIWKAATRLMGASSPVVNTGIRFQK